MKSKTLLSVLSAAVMAAGLLALTEPAQAALPGKNGRIAFVSDRGGSWGTNVYTANPDGTGLARLTTNPTYEEDTDPAWSPDGAKIAFTHHKSGADLIYAMNADGSGQTALADGKSPAWSPDGKEIAFESNFEIYVMKADGSRARRITDDNDLANGYEPSWSPDGAKIAFAGCRKGEPWGIFVMNADGSGAQRLTEASSGSDCSSPYAATDGAPDWSPDGTKIAFARATYRSEGGVYVMNADGTGQTELTGGAHPAWSPDGARITLSKGNPLYGDDYEIYTINADGTGQADITNDPASDTSPDWGVAPGPTATITPPSTTPPSGSRGAHHKRHHHGGHKKPARHA